MVGTIQAIVQNILNNWSLTEYAGGTVIALSPFKVQIHERLIVGSEHLFFVTGCCGYRLVEGCVEPAPDFAVGDRLLLLRVLRGQKYIVLSKVVS